MSSHHGNLKIYNSLSGQKEKFEPLHENRVGMYVCGPTLYSEPHMGNMRTFINFDMIYRYLLVLGYQVKYVRNITDVGHLAMEEAGAGDGANLDLVANPVGAGLGDVALIEAGG